MATDWRIMPRRMTTQTAHQQAIKITWMSFALNVGLTIIKWAAGIWGHSFALIADAIESTNDIFASGAVLIGLNYSKKPPDDNHPYGHGKAESLVTFVVVGFLVASATLIAIQSIHNIRTPHEGPKAFTLAVLVGVIVVKTLFYKLLNKTSTETGSHVLSAEAWHHASDAITSAAAFIGISIALVMGPAYAAADDWAALLAAGFILYNSYLIFRPALGEMMDEHVYHAHVDRIRAVSLGVDGVKGIEKCWMRKSGMHFYVDIHAEVDPAISVEQGHGISHALKDAIQSDMPEIKNVLVHVEPFRDTKS